MTGVEPAVLAACALTAGLLTVPATVAVGRVTAHLGLVDAPRADRFHQRPTPLLGGVAIVGVALLVSAVTRVMTGGAAAASVALGAASGALALLGLFDDVTNASPWLRLTVEGVVAVGVVAMGIRLPVSGLPMVDAVVTIVALVVLVNSFNLLDNSDAALASVAVVTGVGIAVIAVMWSVSDRAVLVAAATGAAAGFLARNRPPARIFMGDVGSLFLGCVLVGSLALVATGEPGPHPVPVLAFLVVPLADTTVVAISRRREGRNLLSGGKDHLHHRLARTRLGVTGAAVTGATVAGLGAVTGIAVAAGWVPVLGGLVVALALWAGLVGWALTQPSGHRQQVLLGVDA